MSSKHWMPTYWGDYFADTGSLSATEHGVYLLLIAEHWQQKDIRLPDEYALSITDNDASSIAQALQLHCMKVARAYSDDEKRAVRMILSRYFELDKKAFCYRQIRVEKELKIHKVKVEKAHKRGLAGAEARWRKNDESNASSIAQALLDDCQPQPHPQPDSSSLSNDKEEIPPTPVGGVNNKNGDKKPKAKKSTKELLGEDLETAQWAYENILLKNVPDAKKPNLETWAHEIRKLRTQDKRTAKEILGLFRWASQDIFWRANVLSPRALRKNWNQLVAKRLHEMGTNKQEKFDPLAYLNGDIKNNGTATSDESRSVIEGEYAVD